MSVVPNTAPTVYVSWTSAQAPAITTVTTLAIYSDGLLVVFGTNSGSGAGSTYFSTNGGISYTQTTTGSGPGTNPINGVAVFYSTTNRFYAVSPGVGLYRYIVGTGWSSQLISSVSNTDQFTSIATSTNGNSTFITSTNASSGQGTITYSVDGGSTWLNFPRLDDGPAPAAGTVIQAMVITSICCDSTGQYVFFTCTGGSAPGAGIYSSAAGGASNYWHRSVSALSFSRVSCSSNGNVVLAIGSGGVYLSTNGNAHTGSGGTALSTATFASAITSTPVNILSCSVSQDGTKLFFTTLNGTGIYYSPDLGTTWRIISFTPNTLSEVSNLALRVDGYPVSLVDKTGTVYYGTTTVLCFKEDTKILCLVDGKESYVPIQTMKPGTLVKTSLDGYKKVDTIGSSKIYNPAHTIRGKNRLYKCTKTNYPEVFEDLVITGCHSILVDDITDTQRKDITELAGRIFVTDNKYRLMACIDERAEPYTEEGIHTIWHFALENDNYYYNYGVYANGLLVETSSKRMMKELSGMQLV